MTCLTAHAHSCCRGRARSAPLTAALVLMFLAAAAGSGAGQVPGAGTPATLTVPPQPPIDPAAALFDGSVLHDLRLAMKPDDWDTLKARFMWDTYYPADLEWRGVKVPMVGVRSRGQGSRNPVKPSIRIDVNRYREEQRFLNLNALILANAAQDPAMLNRRLSMAVFSRVGLPASRVVHARVFVNDEYVGLYEVVEAVEKPFLARVFGRDDSAKKRDEGYLFEYKWETDYQWTYLGPDLASYAPLFEVQTRQMDAPSLVYGPIEDMIRTINEVGDADFQTEVGKYLHLQLFIRHLAVERFISDIDGFLGDWGPNNFYLYRFENWTLSAIIPWDKDSTFYDLLDDIYKGFDRSVLGQRILSLPALRRYYLESLLGCAASVAEPDVPGATVSWFEAELLRQRAQILESARADGNKPYTNERVDEAHQEMLEFVRNRSAVVADMAQRELDRLLQEAK